MKHKIVSFFAAVLITGAGGWAIPSAMAEQPKPQMTQKKGFEVMGRFCATAYREFRRYGTTKYLDQGLKRLDPEGRNFTAGVCLVYGMGYEDGRAWSNVA